MKAVERAGGRSGGGEKKLVRAGMVADPADYRWSSYGEAVGAGGRSAAGKLARGGLVRALLCSAGVGDDPERWSEVSGRYRLLLRQAMERKGRSVAVRQGNEVEAAAGPAVAEFDDPASAADAKVGFAVEMAFAGMLMRRVRYFKAGAVIGSKECVELCFTQARYRFGPKRKTGARRMRGSAKEAAGVIWALRDCSQKERPEILPDA